MYFEFSADLYAVPMSIDLELGIRILVLIVSFSKV